MTTLLEARPVEAKPEDYFRKYAQVAEQLGVMSPDLTIEKFKTVLRELDIPVYALNEVVAHMDAKTNTGWGWEWRPLRSRDQLPGSFGRWAEYGFFRRTRASDYYSYHHSPVYDRTVPLRTLERVARIEEKCRSSRLHVPSFLVSEYAKAPQVLDPDPFLMAVIQNSRMNEGVGRFVIDFWDEPSFGLDAMLARS